MISINGELYYNKRNYGKFIAKNDNITYTNGDIEWEFTFEASSSAIIIHNIGGLENLNSLSEKINKSSIRFNKSGDYLDITRLAYCEITEYDVNDFNEETSKKNSPVSVAQIYLKFILVSLFRLLNYYLYSNDDNSLAKSKNNILRILGLAFVRKNSLIKFLNDKVNFLPILFTYSSEFFAYTLNIEKFESLLSVEACKKTKINLEKYNFLKVRY